MSEYRVIEWAGLWQVVRGDSPPLCDCKQRSGAESIASALNILGQQERGIVPVIGEECIVRDGPGVERRVRVVTLPDPRGRIGVRNVHTGRLSYHPVTKFGSRNFRRRPR